MAALVAVMFVVAANTFDWQSIQPSTLRRLPKSETAVKVVTVVGTIATKNLAIGVVAGVLTACLLFARQSAGRVTIATTPTDDSRRRVYHVSGQLFFTSSAALPARFDYEGDPDSVVIDLASAAICDATSVSVLDTVVARYAQRGKRAELVNLDLHSTNLYASLTGQLGVAIPKPLPKERGGPRHSSSTPAIQS